jgi:hypothetical protein
VPSHVLFKCAPLASSDSLLFLVTRVEGWGDPATGISFAFVHNVEGGGGVELGLERQLAMGTLANAAAILPGSGETRQRVERGLSMLAAMRERLGAPKL